MFNGGKYKLLSDSNNNYPESGNSNSGKIENNQYVQQSNKSNIPESKFLNKEKKSS
jgi:hypothetical protein